MYKQTTQAFLTRLVSSLRLRAVLQCFASEVLPSKRVCVRAPTHTHTPEPSVLYNARWNAQHTSVCSVCRLRCPLCPHYYSSSSLCAQFWLDGTYALGLLYGFTRRLSYSRIVFPDEPKSLHHSSNDVPRSNYGECNHFVCVCRKHYQSNKHKVWAFMM